MYNFYSCLDPRAIAPQPEQHQLIAEMAKSLDGEIVFYGSEDYFCAKSQPFIYKKLKRTANLNGVIFFTFDQFLYSPNLDVLLIKKILGLSLTVNFAREKISIQSLQQLREDFLLYRAYHHAKNQRFSSLILDPQ